MCFYGEYEVTIYVSTVESKQVYFATDYAIMTRSDLIYMSILLNNHIQAILLCRFAFVIQRVVLVQIFSRSSSVRYLVQKANSSP